MGTQKNKGRIVGLRGLKAVRSFEGHPAQVHGRALVFGNVGGAGLQVFNSLFKKSDHRIGPLLFADDFSHQPQGALKVLTPLNQIATAHDDYRNPGFGLQLVRIIACAAEDLEDELGLGRKAQDLLRIVLTTELTEYRHGLELRIGQRIGAAVQFVASGFDVIDRHNHVLALQVAEQTQAARAGTDHMLHPVRNDDLAAHEICHRT